MRINKIELNEFRGFEHKEFSFDPHFNVLIGENGSGKTTILEALTVAINPFVAVVEGKLNTRAIRKEDVRSISFDYSKEKKINTNVKVRGVINGINIEWKTGKRHRDYGFQQTDDSEVRAWAKACLKQLSDNGGEDLILPLFCYLGAGRLWTDSLEKIKTFPKGSRLEGYHNCLNPKGHFKRFVEWFKTMELSALQGNQISKQNADIVRRVVAQSLDGWDNIFYDVAEDSLMAGKTNNNRSITLPFHYLSDGQRNTIGLIADIAYRCILLNPYLKGDCTKRTPGIVLIDEIDLHLHPNWQRSIVQKLKDAFPMIQFITTTHSPFIVQSLSNNELIDMDGKNIDEDYWRKGIEEIAQEEMGVTDSQRSEHFLKMKNVADEYYQLVVDNKENKNAQNIARVKEELDKLMLPYLDDPAYVSFLESFKHQLD